jgi:hypothetical protein
MESSVKSKIRGVNDPRRLARYAWMGGILLVLLIVRVAEASADPRPTYTELLRKGQRLEASGDHTGAVDASRRW